MIVNELLIDWYEKNGRKLPWRETKDPYKIWVSEIILQQTRIDQGLNYYLNFIKHFPTVQDLADSDLDQVLFVWQGLGYYSRARNMHHTAKFVANDLDGVFPKTYEGLLKLKGIGTYTAAAIASIVYDEAVSVIDGNVYRLYSRLYLVEEAIDTSKGKKLFLDLAKEVMVKRNPGQFNQAIMDFGSMQCIPKKPKCETCVLNPHCLAYELNAVDRLPVKVGKLNTRKRYFAYIIIIDGKYTFIQKRTRKDIWEGLYEFPLVESNNSHVDIGDSDHIFITGIIEGPVEIQYISAEKIHLLSHQRIHAKLVCIKAKIRKEKEPDYIKIPFEDLNKYPFPKLLNNFINEFKTFIKKTI